MALVDHLLEMIRKLLAVQKRANRSNSQTLLGIQFSSSQGFHWHSSCVGIQSAN